MKFIRTLLEKQEELFGKGKKLEKLYPLHEALDTFLFTPGSVNKGTTHVREALDLKRMMITVVIALLPCVFMAFYNTGYQANYFTGQGAAPLDTWQSAFYYEVIGYARGDLSFAACFVHGALYFVPIFAMTFLVGGHIEVLFAVVRKHEVNLCLQVFVGIIFVLFAVHFCQRNRFLVTKLFLQHSCSLCILRF